ncbi:MAG: FHA domain-containing protein [Candidatus Aminicenantes bacterium]|nr:FHA domain-containing protein [Candidatus Aminicenantes bacterium]
MKKQSFLDKIFKKKTVVEKLPEPVIKTEHEIAQPEEFPFTMGAPPPMDVPVPELDDREIIGELDVLVNKTKIANHKIDSPTRVGRDPAQADIIVTELIVSKLHCTIYVQDGTVFVQDNSSTNGTYVYNQKINLQPIEDNTMIGLGKKGTVQLIFRKGGTQ